MDTPHSSSEQNSPVESADLSGVTISGQATVTAHDIIGRDKIIHGDEYIGYSAAQVTVLLDKIRTEYQSKPFDGRSPYIGLASFQERDAEKFFGRERLIAELVTRVATSAASNARALFVAGPSGSGKSSLVRAGLVPALKKGQVAGSEHWLYETLKPGRAPLDELGLAVAKLARNSDLRNAMTTRGLTDATFLNQQADMALTDDSKQRAVIVIDQFEEIFTQLTPERENERVAFLNLLTHAVTVENGRALVIFTLRSDFVANCASYPNLNALVNQEFIQVGAMTPDELVSAIARPAYQVGLRIDPALISQIVNDVRGEPGALPLMQFALQDLFEAEKSKGELTLDGYLKRGGLHEALERHADAEFAKLDDAEKQLTRSVFSGLVETGRGREDTKRSALFSELVPAGADATRVKTLISKLADVRLITTDEQDGKETVTLAHERLIDAWGWLRKLVDENRDAIALQNEIAQDAQEWETHNRDESYLYRGARLATAQEKLQQNKLVLSGLAKAFVKTALAAREEAKRKEARRTRRLLVAFGAAAAVFAVLSVLAFFLWQTGIASEKRAVEQEQIAVHEVMTATIALGKAEIAGTGVARAVETATIALGKAEVNRQFAETREAEAIIEKNRAEAEQKISRSRELASLALNEIDKDPERAVLIAVRANQVAVTFESEDALRRSILAAPLAILRGHARIVNSAKFSPDGNKIVTASNDFTARIWDAITGKSVVTLRGHTDKVNSAQFSQDGNRIVTESSDTTTRVWDAVTGRELTVLRGLGSIRRAEFSPDGTKILTTSLDNPPRVWDVVTGKEIVTLRGHLNAINSAHFSSDGSKIVTASDDSTARIWDAATGQEIVKLIGHTESVMNARFSPDGRKIVTGSQDWTARIWDTVTGQEIVTMKGHTGDVETVEFARDGKRIVSAGDNIARIWDASTGKELIILRGHTSTVTSAHFSQGGDKIVTTSWDGTSRIWSTISGTELAILRFHVGQVVGSEFSADGKKIVTVSHDTIVHVWDAATSTEFSTLLGHIADLRSAQFAPNGELIATASDDNTVGLWELETGKKFATLRGHTSAVMSAQFSTDGTKIVTASLDHTARIWDVVTGKELLALHGHADSLNRAQFSPDGTKIVSASDDNSARIWDSITGKEIATLKGHTSYVRSAQFSPDGTKIVTASWDGTARIWNAVTEQELVTLRVPEGSVNIAQFSPDGTKVVTASLDNTSRIWDAFTGKELGILKGHTGNITSVQFSPDGSRIVTASWDTSAKIWDTATGKELVTLRGHSAPLNDARFSLDGSKIVTASGTGVRVQAFNYQDTSVRVWDASTGKEISVLRGHTDIVNSAQFSPDNTKIVTASDDNTARLYLVGVEDLLTLAKQRIGRSEFTCEERVQYLHEEIVCPTPTSEASPTP